MYGVIMFWVLKLYTGRRHRSIQNYYYSLWCREIVLSVYMSVHWLRKTVY